MEFFTDRTRFTHTGSFYGVPIYLNLSDDIPVISGTNILFDWLFSLMVLFHNYVIEFGAQTFAALLDQDYEAGFPVTITGTIEK